MIDCTAPVSHAQSELAGPRQRLYYEDMEPGEGLTSPEQVIDRKELVDFARAWDPMPFHVDDEAAFGSITAPGVYMLAVKQRLVHRLPPLEVIASLGFDELRFHRPLRPGDIVRVALSWASRRPSESNPSRGIVRIRYRLVNASGQDVMSHMDTVLVRRRTQLML